MTDIAALEAYAGLLSEAVSRANAASSKQHAYVHSDELTDILTESGWVPSLAKQARLAREKTIPEINIKDAPYSAKLDGRDESAVFIKFVGDLATSGGRGRIPAGHLNAEQARIKKLMAEGFFKSFEIFGDGDSTRISLGNIDPIFTPGANQKGLQNEPHFVDLRGLAIAKSPHPTCTFRDFHIEYSAQRFKGGADESAPALTDIDPLSLGMKLFYSEYGRIVVEGVTAEEVYGEFVQLVRSPFSIIRDNFTLNVSAGNIGRNDSSGAFALVLRGSATGTQITGNRAINKRVYLTDTVKGFTDRSAKNTPCGYIGVGLEYGNNVGGTPAVDYELWENAGKPNYNTLHGIVTGNHMHGYYIGYKAESDVSFSMRDNIATCCWMPYVISSGCVGDVTSNEADRGYLDDLVQPMGGYRYVQGMYTHLHYRQDMQDTPDVIFDKNKCIARSIPVFATNSHNSKFLNQMTVMDGAVSLVMAAANVPLTGLEVSGSVLIKSLAADYTTLITDFKGAKIDLRIVNKSSYQYLLQFNRYYAAASPYKANVTLDADGVVGVAFSGCTPDPFRGNFKLTDVTKAFNTGSSDSNRFLYVNDAYGGEIHATFQTHSKAVTGYPAIVYMGGGEVTADLHIADAGENLFSAAIRVGSAKDYSSPALTLRKHVDAYNIPFISYYTRYSRSLRVRAVEGKGSLFNSNTNFGPVYLSDPNCTSLSSSGTAEPNVEANLRYSTVADGEAYYLQGTRFPYLRTNSGGREGTLCTVTGWRALGWAASTDVAVNTYRQVNSKVYLSTSAGTTGTVAPSHAGGAAADGTVTWSYVGPQAVFKEYGSIG